MHENVNYPPTYQKEDKEIQHKIIRKQRPLFQSSRKNEIHILI